MELSTEFYRALAVSWLCFAAGACIFHAYRWCDYGKVLSRLLLALSPGILSAYGFHSVQVCNQILAAKEPQGMSVNGRVYLTSISRADYGDGYSLEIERYSDGTSNVSGLLPVAGGRIEGSNARVQASDAIGQRPTRGMVPMQIQSEPAGHWERHTERDL
jgi:hypothetical protein